MLYYAMFDVDDIIEKYGEAIDETDPKQSACSIMQCSM